ncbi:hypothetical protein SK128_025278 [Halocaridina rubra]|uniref:Uncharacterized protein n=1 Tax=Halocaridina rubra TaxID=373956 RepID=A0AAN8WJH8_HALRR
MTEHKSQRDLSPVKDEGLPTRFKSERKSRRELSPHRPPPVSDIVKGETPMPEAVPLVSNAHMSSVRARAAAFDSARGPREPEKDPAERSVQERRAMFTKHQGGALVPKAPFGQSVPAKSIQSSGSGTTKESSRGTSVVYSEPVQKPTKKMASGPSPVKSQQTQEGHRSPSPSTVGSQRMRFENIYDNWRENEINSKIQAERQKDMDVLFNRFKRPKPQPPQAVNERGIYNAESETEYVESDESYAESTASDDPPSGFNRGTGGPPKPPRLYLDSVSPGSSTMSASPPLQPPTFSDNSPVRKIRSPASRLNSTEINESRSSPKKEYIPKIKPGCLFPSLSDIESHSEAPDSQDEDEVQDSSFAESILTCASVESLGQKIKQAAQANMNKQLSTIAERSEIPSTFQLGYTMSDSTLDAIEAIDNAIDEALYDEATPPKRQRSQENEATNVYKTPKIDPGSSRHDVEDQTALAHSISMYRKQKPVIMQIVFI